jgi:hypothetical protein
MKSSLSVVKSRSIGKVVCSALLTLVVGMSLPLFAAEKPAVNSGPTLTAKEAQELVAKASTASDHLKLAQYFNQEAAAYEADAANHDAMIVEYHKNAVIFSRNTLEGSRNVKHCEFLAKSNRQMAAAAREMATGHEAMAQKSAK